MSDSRAAGRKTDLPRYASGQAEALLARQIAAMSGFIEDQLEISQRIPLELDPDGRAAESRLNIALSMAKMSGKLALALAKMQGEVSYNFNYNHSGRPQDDADAPSPSKIPRFE